MHFGDFNIQIEWELFIDEQKILCAISFIGNRIKCSPFDFKSAQSALFLFRFSVQTSQYATHAFTQNSFKTQTARIKWTLIYLDGVRISCTETKKKRKKKNQRKSFVEIIETFHVCQWQQRFSMFGSCILFFSFRFDNFYLFNKRSLSCWTLLASLTQFTMNGLSKCVKQSQNVTVLNLLVFSFSFGDENTANCIE